MRHARVYELLLGQTSEYNLDHILCFSDAFCTDPKYDVEVALQWQDALQYLPCAKTCQINLIINKKFVTWDGALWFGSIIKTIMTDSIKVETERKQKLERCKNSRQAPEAWEEPRARVL